MASDAKGRTEHVGCDGSVNGSSLSRIDIGPIYDVKRENWDEWSFQGMLHLASQGFAATIDGDNRAGLTSSDPAVMAKYKTTNRELFRRILRMLDLKSICGKEMLLKIRDESGDDADGYGLWEYLRMWANDMTPAEVKQLHLRIRALRCSRVQCNRGQRDRMSGHTRHKFW